MKIPNFENYQEFLEFVKQLSSDEYDLFYSVSLQGTVNYLTELK